MLWDASDTEGRTALQVAAATPLRALPETLGAGFLSGREFSLSENQSISSARLEASAWQELVGDAVKASGQPISNPGRLLTGSNPIDLVGDAISEAVSGKPWALSARGRYEAVKAETRAQLAALNIPVPTDQDIHDRMQKIADEKLDRRNAAIAGGGWGAVGAYLGEMAGVLEDPPNVASLALGAPAGVGVLRAMAIEAGVNMGVEASNQVAVTALKQDLGRDYGVGDAALAVGTAGVGAAGLTALGHGAAAILRAFRKARELKPELGDVDIARAGETVAARQAIAEETAPRPDFDGEEAHAAALDAAEAALNGGDPFRAPEYATGQLNRTVASTVEKRVETSPDLVEAYIAKYGRVVDPDKAKEVFPEYQADPERMAAVVHEASSSLAKKVFTRVLEMSPDAPVIFSAGGGGSGKTEALNRVGRHLPDAIIYDSTLSSEKSAIAKIEQALDAGHRVMIFYTNTPVEQAFRFSLGRKRAVPIRALAEGHAGAAEVIRALAKRYDGDPRVAIEVVNNFGGPGEIGPGRIDDVPRYTYNDLVRRLHETASQALASGTISPSRFSLLVDPQLERRDISGLLGRDPGPEGGAPGQVLGRSSGRSLTSKKPDFTETSRSPDFRPLPASLRAPGDGRRPVSLLEFLKREGGMRDEGGELAAFDLGRRRPGLVSKKGRPLDYARERAAEAGYIPPEATLNDFVDAVRREAGGAAVYRAEDLGAVAAWRGYEDAVREAADLLGGTDAARGLSEGEYAEALDVARGHRAWEAGPGKSAPISDTEAAALVDAARSQGRELSAVVDDYAEARASLLDYARRRAIDDDPIPFDIDGETPRAETVAADETGRWAQAQDTLAADPEMTVPWPWEGGAPDARHTLRDLFALTDEWDADAAEAMACAALGAVA